MRDALVRIVRGQRRLGAADLGAEPAARERHGDRPDGCCASTGGLTATGLVSSLIVDNQIVDFDRARHSSSTTR